MEIINKTWIRNVHLIFKNIVQGRTCSTANVLGDKIQDGCHEISFYLIEKYEMFKAVTSICKKGIDNSYYHSFILDDEKCRIKNINRRNLQKLLKNKIRKCKKFPENTRLYKNYII